jgi:low affinity Fe/Cu permease
LDSDLRLLASASMRPTKSTSWFTRLTKATSRTAGRPVTSLLAVVIIIVWAALGPIFKFSDTWQLVINTGTTIVTFLMVFLIQSTQNRDTEAIQVKLDELIRAVGHARNELLDLEELEEKDLDELKQTFTDLAKKARQQRVESHRTRSET